MWNVIMRQSVKSTMHLKLLLVEVPLSRLFSCLIHLRQANSDRLVAPDERCEDSGDHPFLLGRCQSVFGGRLQQFVSRLVPLSRDVGCFSACLICHLFLWFVLVIHDIQSIHVMTVSNCLTKLHFTFSPSTSTDTTFTVVDTPLNSIKSVIDISCTV